MSSLAQIKAAICAYLSLMTEMLDGDEAEALALWLKDNIDPKRARHFEYWSELEELIELEEDYN